MALAVEKLLAELDDALSQVDESRFQEARFGGHVAECIVRLSAVIERLAPDPSMYRARANAALSAPMMDRYRAAELAAIARVMREDYAKGYVGRTVNELVRSEVFEDFLGMAEELVRSDYFIPAAVLAGSVLEEHVHSLAKKRAITPVRDNGRPRSLDELAIELVRETELTESERKLIQAWYGQRTEAAHGRPENVIDQEVTRMVSGIRDFIARHSA